MEIRHIFNTGVNFSIHAIQYTYGYEYSLFYTNRGFVGGVVFCSVKNGKIASGPDWCFLIEDHIVDLCINLYPNRAYDFDKYFRGALRDASITKLIG